MVDRWMFWTKAVDQVIPLAVVFNCTDSVIIKYSHSHLTVYFIKKFCGKHFTGAVRALSWIRIGTITTKGMNCRMEQEMETNQGSDDREGQK